MQATYFDARRTSVEVRLQWNEKENCHNDGAGAAGPPRAAGRPASLRESQKHILLSVVPTRWRFCGVCGRSVSLLLGDLFLVGVAGSTVEARLRLLLLLLRLQRVVDDICSCKWS
jgi:hypothetical protein